MNDHTTYAQRGNVLFIIMLGIALFAALSLAVTQSGKNVGGAGREKTNLIAAEVIDYGAVLAAATQKMLISNSCADTDISFETPALTGYEHSPVAPDTCKIFGPSGGRLIYKKPDERWLDLSKSAEATYGAWAFVGTNAVPDVGAKGMTDYTFPESKELMAFLPWLHKDVCVAINKKLGLVNPGGNPPREASAFSLETPFAGEYASAMHNLEMVSGALHGKLAACFEGNGGTGNKTTGTYFFYQVLIAR